MKLTMAALSALPWKTSCRCLRAPLSYHAFYHVDASKIFGRLVHTESRKDSSKELSKKEKWKQAKQAWFGRLKDGSLESWDARQRTMSISINQHGSTPDEAFFELCGKLRPRRKSWDQTWRPSQKSSRLTVLLLYTPSFTPWFNDSTFIPKILERLSYDKQDSHPLNFDVLEACVDGIAPHMDNGSPHRQSTTQGFSILYSRKAHMSNWKRPQAKSQPIVPYIQFSFHNIPACVDVPLANTLFHTGRPNESVMSRWEAKDGKFVEVVGREHVSAFYIQDGTYIDAPLGTYIPGRPITPFRKIEAGVGNIIRKLEFKDGNIGPASQELETAVSSISESLGGVTVDVWALIVPPAVFNAEKETVPESSPEYVGSWINRGARICRVVSGGGGWGPKQGLLSLEQDAIILRKMQDSLDEEDVFSLGNIAEAGSLIQFLAVDDNPPVRQSPSSVWKPFRHGKSMVFGTIPSTIDDIPQVNNGSEQAQYEFRMNHFGCVSGSGIYYKHALKNSLAPEIVSDTTEASKSLEGGKSQDQSPSSSKSVKFLESSEADVADGKNQPPTPMETTKITLPYSYLYFDSQEALSHLKITPESSAEEKSFRIVKHDSGNFFRKIQAVPETEVHEDGRLLAMSRYPISKVTGQEDFATPESLPPNSIIKIPEDVFKKMTPRQRAVEHNRRYLDARNLKPPKELKIRTFLSRKIKGDDPKIAPRQNAALVQAPHLNTKEINDEVGGGSRTYDDATAELKIEKVVTNYKGFSPFKKLITELQSGERMSSEESGL